MQLLHSNAVRRALAGFLALVLLGLVLGPLAAPALAGSRYERERHLRHELNRLPVEHGVAHAKMKAAAVEVRRLDGAAKWLDRKIREREAWLPAAAAKTAKLARAEQIEARRLAAAEGQLVEVRRGILDKVIAASAAELSPTGPVEVLLSVSDKPELEAASAVVGIVVETKDAAVDQPLAEVRRRKLRHDAMRGRREAAEALRARIASSRAELVARRTEVGKLRWKAHYVYSERKRKVEAIRHTARAFRDELDWYVRTPAALEHELGQHHRGQRKRPATRGAMTSPLPGVRVNSNFGPRVHPITGRPRWHTGIDFPAPTGTPVRATAGGKVFSATNRGGYGLTVVLDHGKATATLYAHLSRIAVYAGDKVKRGQVIGYVGTTGFSTGPHLHFEVRQHGRPDQPLNWL